MTKKIFTGVISVSLIIMLVCVGLVMGIMDDYMGQKLDDQTEGRGRSCRRRLEDRRAGIFRSAGAAAKYEKPCHGAFS